MPEVIIDGIRYVPVMESQADMKKIAAGVLESFWSISSLKDLPERMEDMHVYVNDSGKGIPMAEFMGDIAEALRKKYK